MVLLQARTSEPPSRPRGDVEGSMKSEEQNRLKQNIQQVCRAHQDQLHFVEDAYRPRFMVDHKHRVAFCRHGKVGTTTWMKHFIKLLPQQDWSQFMKMNSHQLHEVIPGHFSLTKRLLGHHQSVPDFFAQDRYYVFSFIRHPFDRSQCAILTIFGS